MSTVAPRDAGSSPRGLLVFASCWLGLAVLAAVLLGAVEPRIPWLHAAVVALLVTPLALLAGLRFGPLGEVGVALTALAMGCLLMVSIGAILDAVARPAGGAVAWWVLLQPPHVARTVVQLGAMTVVPVLWLALLRQRAR